jgi:hypothetical protein
MPQVPDAVAPAGRVVFELDRFAITGDDLCLVEGCWFGVRGRRFIRPSLTVTVDGSETRLLADLADKPWAAEDGEPWRATFPVATDIGDIELAELTVAPDITIVLGETPSASDSRKPKPSTRRTQRSRTRGTRDVAERRRRELDRVKTEKAEAQTRLDEVLEQLAAVARERDEAAAESDALRAERDDATAERDRLRAERDRLIAEREHEAVASESAGLAYDRAQADRDAAIAAQRRAESERDLAVAECDRAISQRDEALSSRDHAVAERDAAMAARDESARQRDAMAGASERLQTELAELSSTRGAALVMRRAVQEGPYSRRSPLVGPVTAAILLVLAVVVVLIVTRSL